MSSGRLFPQSLVSGSRVPVSKRRRRRPPIPDAPPADTFFHMLPTEILYMIDFWVGRESHAWNLFLAWNLQSPQIVAQRLGWHEYLKRPQGVLQRLIHNYCKLCGSPGYKRKMVPRAMGFNRCCVRCIYGRGFLVGASYHGQCDKVELASRLGHIYVMEFRFVYPLIDTINLKFYGHVRFHGRLWFNLNHIMNYFEREYYKCYKVWPEDRYCKESRLALDEFGASFIFREILPLKKHQHYRNIRAKASKYLY